MMPITWYLQSMTMNHPDQKLGKMAIIVAGLFIVACIVLLVLAFVLN
ncbi:MAG: hypothetical protein MK089_03485 [Phycisphaerales bacterium]|nr:hypothetical protein [Phycisphaerales bacterium]